MYTFLESMSSSREIAGVTFFILKSWSTTSLISEKSRDRWRYLYCWVCFARVLGLSVTRCEWARYWLARLGCSAAPRESEARFSSPAVTVFADPAYVSWWRFTGSTLPTTMQQPRSETHWQRSQGSSAHLIEYFSWAGPQFYAGAGCFRWLTNVCAFTAHEWNPRESGVHPPFATDSIPARSYAAHPPTRWTQPA
jgi:hypothetical protein